MKRLILWGALLLIVGVLFPGTAQGDFLYWGYGTRIQRANLDTMEIQTDLLPDVEFPSAFDVDPINGKIYWSANTDGAIQRANLDGSEVEDVVSGLERLGPISVDPASGKLYWGDYQNGDDGIRRANLDGSMMEDVTDLIMPISMAIDSGGGYAYCTAIGVPGNAVYRVRLDGSGIQEITPEPVFLTGVALDGTGGKVYWADLVARDVPGKIQRANLDGTEIETIVAGFVARPIGLAVDSSAGKLYWSDAAWGTIYRADLDGSDIEVLFTGFENGPGPLVFVSSTVPEPSSIFMALSAGMALIAVVAWRGIRRSGRTYLIGDNG